MKYTSIYVCYYINKTAYIHINFSLSMYFFKTMSHYVALAGMKLIM